MQGGRLCLLQATKGIFKKQPKANESIQAIENYLGNETSEAV